MQATITMQQLHWDPALMGFFFREQSEETYNELMSHCTTRQDREKVWDAIEDYFCDLDEVEEMFYNDSIDEILERIGLLQFEEAD